MYLNLTPLITYKRLKQFFINLQITLMSLFQIKRNCIYNAVLIVEVYKKDDVFCMGFQIKDEIHLFVKEFMSDTPR